MRVAKRGVVVLCVLLVLWAMGCDAGGAGLGPAAVETRVETLVLPAYPVGPTSEFPEFVRTSGLQQGRRRGVYPYTLQRDLGFERRRQRYQAYVLQNEYLRIEVLPTLGGRVFALYDRSAKKDAVYRQVSIKPGLVGLRGAWISGGIEWNFPRSHSVTTFDTVSCRFLRHDDGSASIVVGDRERCFRMSWTVQMTLRPGRACLEARIVCRNPTALWHEGYWWTNAGFPATDRTQIILPANKVTGHDAYGASDWPIRNGKDVSWYREYPGASSVFRAAGEEDFIAAYDHDLDVGLAQYADRRVMPGRKWWTWGTNDSGMRWAGILSDDKRPYVEIQSGDPLTQSRQFRVQPHEERQYLEYWMPVTRIGPPVRVNPRAIVRLTVDDGVATVGVLPMERFKGARIQLLDGQQVIRSWQRSISPAEVLLERCPLVGTNPSNLRLRVLGVDGQEIIAHEYGKYAPGPLLFEPAPRPRNWRDRPEPPVDKLTAATALVRQGLYPQAAKALRALVGKAEKGIDPDAVRYFLGLAEAGCGRTVEATKHWNAIQTAGPMREAATIEAAKQLLAVGRWPEAIARLQPLTARRGPRPDTPAVWGPVVEADIYTALALRQMKRPGEARACLRRALRRDPLALLGQIELALLDGRPLEGGSALRDEQRRIEAATAYMAVKEYAVAERLLRPAGKAPASATALYLRAHVAELAGRAPDAARRRREAARTSVRGCMPSRMEELAALQAALTAHPKDSSANFLAGLALYGFGRKAEAMAHWRYAAALGHGDAVVYRCLGSAMVDAQPSEALKFLERAAALAPDAPEVYADLDHAHMLLGDAAKRVEVLRRGLDRLPDQDVLAHRLGVAYFDAGQYDDAVKCYQSHRFHVAEGQRDLHDHYAIALLGRAMAHLSAGRNKQALADLDASLEYPENLSIGRSARTGSNATVQYWRGVALKGLGRPDDAQKAWQQGVENLRFRRRRRFYRPESALNAMHAVISLRRLGQCEQADALARQIQDAAKRLEEFAPSRGRALAAMIAGFLAAADGQQAAGLLDKAQGVPGTTGYLRVIRTWAELLKRSPASQPAKRPQEPPERS